VLVTAYSQPNKWTVGTPRLDGDCLGFGEFGQSTTDEKQDESVTQNPAGQELERPGVKCKAVDDALSFACASDDDRKSLLVAKIQLAVVTCNLAATRSDYVKSSRSNHLLLCSSQPHRRAGRRACPHMNVTFVIASPRSNVVSLQKKDVLRPDRERTCNGRALSRTWITS
jgi:hypothetical protein